MRKAGIPMLGRSENILVHKKREGEEGRARKRERGGREVEERQCVYKREGERVTGRSSECVNEMCE